MNKILLAVAILFTGPALGAEREVAGVKLADTLRLEGVAEPLRLNGAGVRSKFFVKVYVGALYTGQVQRDAKALMDSPGAKSVRMHFLHDEVSAEKLRDAWSDGFRANQDEAGYARLAERLARFNGAFRTVKRGEVIRLDLIPEKGTQVWINGELRDTIAGADFQRALLAVWLGEHPADGSLKRAMLGMGD